MEDQVHDVQVGDKNLIKQPGNIPGESEGIADKILEMMLEMTPKER